MRSLDDPGYVLRCVLIDAMKLFLRLTGREPKKIGLTIEMLELLWDHMAQQRLRLDEMEWLFGLEVDWGARGFYLE